MRKSTRIAIEGLQEEQRELEALANSKEYPALLQELARRFLERDQHLIVTLEMCNRKQDRIDQLTELLEKTIELLEQRNAELAAKGIRGERNE